MNSLYLALGIAMLFLIAYHTYGKFLARKIFRLDPDAVCPSKELQDNIDFVPTQRPILFGHHFASIAGTGPIVGPAIAIIWGWVPAVTWVIVGSVFMGAVHDFGSMVVSLRNQGRSIGDIASDVINKRARVLFLLIIFFELWIVVAIFGVVIAIVFSMFPQAVIPVWLQTPIALWLGHMVYKKDAPHLPLSIVAVIMMYITVVIGAYVPIKMPAMFGLSPLALWVIILLIYAYIASTLPVQVLLQPRDYINSHQLFVAFVLLALGILFAHPAMVAPATNFSPECAPPICPMIFVIMACGAISGFHSLVSSGTSSKQCDIESSSLAIGYGGMLMEAMLAIFVIIACGAGLALGLTKDGQTFTGLAAFSQHYASWRAAAGLGSKISAFVMGSTNMIDKIGIPHRITLTIMGVFVVSFAATTLDTATRLQRYIVSELSIVCRVPALGKRHPATLIAVITALFLAFYNGSGKGALTLWPLFGSVNQLLAGLALLVVTAYLAYRKILLRYTMIPMLFMLFMTGWAMIINMETFYLKSNWLLFSIGLVVFALEIWMVIESVLVLHRVYGKKSESGTQGLT
ncbi:MAG: carbon starvation protein A [Thermodesulfobacteriota bacterium]|nr:MAG: carbon starvation protein A [Thermodesulfobacteriota bacterium]RLF92466.1 MAG: carbon starvation protein A [Thermococci archaeon]